MVTDYMEGNLSYLHFFGSLFGAANTLLREQLKCSGKKFSNSRALASWWRKWLESDLQGDEFYDIVIEETRSRLRAKKEVSSNSLVIQNPELNLGPMRQSSGKY